MLSNVVFNSNSTGNLTVTAPMHTTSKLTIGDMDVGRSLKMFMWYLEVYHPEVIHQFKCIEDIEKV